MTPRWRFTVPVWCCTSLEFRYSLSATILLPYCYNDSMQPENPVEIVAGFWQQYGLPGKKLVIAVSGGPDSVCLLHILYGLVPSPEQYLHVAHLDHQLRGEESRLDAAYVAALAGGMGLACTIEQADVRSYQTRFKLSLEEAARQVRYQFLSGVAGQEGTPFIVTGHTRNDQIETILLHLIRGSGTRGLIGLKPLTPRTIDDNRVTLVRPMLAVSRQQTLDYCRQHGLRPRVDSTNLSLSPLRNRVRMQLVPLLESYNPSVAEALLRVSTLAADEMEYMSDQVCLAYSVVVRRRGEALELDRSGMNSLHKAVKRHLLRYCIREAAGDLKDIEDSHIEAMLALLDKPAGRHIDLPYALVFVSGYDSFWLGREEAIPCPYPVLDAEYVLSLPGVTRIPGWEVRAQIIQYAGACHVPGISACFDPDRVGQQLSVRAWRSGDRFQPLGMDREKKVGRFMLDARVPRRWRSRIPLVLSGGRIIWLVGYRIDERFKVTHPAAAVLNLRFNPVPW